MAELRNDSGALRLALTLVAREGDGSRILATIGVESLDQRDGEWWPLVRLPPLHVPAAALAGLATDLVDLLRGATGGFAWSPSPGAPVAVQLAAAPGGAQLELGLDLGGLLADNAGVPFRAESDLALFRWRALQQDLVLFADALPRELEALPR